MEKNLVLDLEHVLMIGINWKILHPEAEQVLKRSKKDFDKTYLWTYCKASEGIDILKEFKLLEYFNGVLGLELSKNPTKIYTTLHKFDDCKNIGREKFEIIKRGDLSKNLNLLGDPNKYVLIEDKPTNGKPLERVVEIMPFQAQKDHSLLDAYNQALDKF